MIPMPNNWDSIAEYYDGLCEILWPLSDLEFWLDLAHNFRDRKQRETAMLELGSGTGRVLIHLAKHGCRISGLESSEKMINVYRKKERNLPTKIRDRIMIYKGDMRAFDLGRKFDMIICPSNTWPFLIKKADRIRALTSIYENLRDDGLLGFDLLQKDLSKVSTGKLATWNLWSYETGQKVYPLSQKRIFWCEYCTVRPKGGWEQVEISFAQIGKRTISFTEKFLMKLLDKTEVEKELNQAGFGKRAIYGDYERHRWNRQSPHMIFVAEKKK